MKLSVVIPVLNQIDLAKTCFKEIRDNVTDVGDPVEFIILDNGSDDPIQEADFAGATVIRLPDNIGVYPTFAEGMKRASGEIVAFLHSDVVIWEKSWNLRVVSEFINNKKLGLMGFIGSNEIDSSGGRGGGTASNFQGREITDGLKKWKGSDWTHHGKHLTDCMKGAVVDGCVMILRRDAWNRIGARADFPPHHFYDRLISTQILENNYDINVLGIEFDHISGQTVNQEKKYQLMAYEWLWANGYVAGAFEDDHNYDSDIYKIAEDKWLKEYRDKRLVPITI